MNNFNNDNESYFDRENIYSDSNNGESPQRKGTQEIIQTDILKNITQDRRRTDVNQNKTIKS